MIEVIRGSLVNQELDAIVNAANPMMRGGGGIDGKIHQAAGPEMLRELQRVAPRLVPVAQAVVTPGFALPARYVLHVAGPIWRGGTCNESELLGDCYRNATLKADDLKCRTLGFCSISTGTYRFPVSEAAQIAVATLRETLERCIHIERVVFAMFGAAEFEAFQKALN